MKIHITKNDIIKNESNAKPYICSNCDSNRYIVKLDRGLEVVYLQCDDRCGMMHAIFCNR